jgi:hypothetical protein
MKSILSRNARRAAVRRFAMAGASLLAEAASAFSVASMRATIARAVVPPSRALLRPTKSLAWIEVVPS